MKDAAYWMALAHLPRWGYSKINGLIIKFHHERKISIEEFFQLGPEAWKSDYELNPKQVDELTAARAEVPALSFLAESFFSQGYEMIPITSPEYSKTLKANLKATHAPALLYVKGNKNILNEKSVAIVGSRDASQRALDFTDNIAKKASKTYKVVVSGFAKGVDKQALDSAIKYRGQSIIVLPQGIMTFGSGFNTYYKQIIDGDVLVLSVFLPKAPWKAELAMARNPIIYGLADEIFVAESSEKGGTWSGVIDGLRKGRRIYVRKPDDGESNANRLLIDKGALAVNFEGEVISQPYEPSSEVVGQVNDDVVQQSLDERIVDALTVKGMTAPELIKKLGLDWKPDRMTRYLKKLEGVEAAKVGRKNLFRARSTPPVKQGELF